MAATKKRVRKSRTPSKAPRAPSRSAAKPKTPASPKKASRPAAKAPSPRPRSAKAREAAALAARRSASAKKAAATRARNAALRAREAAALTRKRSASAKKAAVTRALKAERAESVRKARAKGAKRGWSKRRAKQTVIEAVNDPRAAAYGLHNLSTENGRVYAQDSKGTKRQLYTITNTQTGEVVHRWGDAYKLEGYDPKTYQEAYEDLDPEIYTVSFEFEFGGDFE